jgi:hypothetical protein
MISFVLSLFLIDRQQRQWRLSQHISSSRPSWWTRATHWSYDPQPYQDQNSTWQRHDKPGQQNDHSHRAWFARKQHRAIAKMEIGDALEMRNRVIVALAAWAVVGLAALYYATKALYGWLTRH